VQKYECVFILRADRPESEMQVRVDRIANILTEHEGEITHQDRWGVRRLAYEIDDETKGNYMLMRFRGRGTAVAEIDRALRLDDQVLRHLVVVDEDWEERNRAAMAKRRQARTGAESRDR
jgi:small subunit ribosomal protein S6